MDFINSLEAYLPEIKMRMEVSEKADLAAVEKHIGQPLPESFKQLYEEYNGEKDGMYTGLCLGFSLMNAESILDTFKFFQENKTWEITSLSAGKVSDEKMCDRIMVPFAWDGSRGYFCLDMSPDLQGKKGQVVALDDDECTQVADSIEEFYAFILRMLKEKRCFLEWEDESEKYFSFETGHFFNVMRKILAEKDGDNSVVQLPEVFWQEHFGACEVPVSELRTVSKLTISKGELNISLTPIAYMSNLRKLIIHNCTFEDFEVISQAAQLKELAMVNCTFAYEKLGELTKLVKLKELVLRKMPITDICCLKEAKSLRMLRLLSLESLDVKQLAELTQLQELELEDLKVDNVDFLANLKELKKLEINKVNVPNLEFLQYLTNLTHLKLHDKVADESGLEFVKDLKQLKEFEYMPTGGKDAIVSVFEKIYPGQTNPLHYDSSLKLRLRGQEPLERISVYDGGDYWHFVTFGLSELYTKKSENKEVSGFGMEFTLKLKKVNEKEDEVECKGIYNILQSISRITFQKNEIFKVHEFLYTGQEKGMDVGQCSNITGFITVPESKQTYLDTPNGRVELVEFVGVTDAELKKIINEEITVQELYAKLGTDVTSYHRGSCY